MTGPAVSYREDAGPMPRDGRSDGGIRSSRDAPLALGTGGDLGADALISGSPFALLKLIREDAGGASGPTSIRAGARVAGDVRPAA